MRAHLSGVVDMQLAGVAKPAGSGVYDLTLVEATATNFVKDQPSAGGGGVDHQRTAAKPALARPAGRQPGPCGRGWTDQAGQLGGHRPASTTTPRPSRLPGRRLGRLGGKGLLAPSQKQRGELSLRLLVPGVAPGLPGHRDPPDASANTPGFTSFGGHGFRDDCSAATSSAAVWLGDMVCGLVPAAVLRFLAGLIAENRAPGCPVGLRQAGDQTGGLRAEC